jgi:hypothetical protein
MSIEDYHAYTGHLASQAMQRRAETGLPNCRPPLGYRLERTPEGSRVVIDEQAARFVRQAFASVAAGHSVRKTLRELTEAGMRSQGGKVMSAMALWKILRNPFYYGYLQHRGALLPGGHDAVIAKESFDTVQRQLTQPTSRPKPAPSPAERDRLRLKSSR